MGHNASRATRALVRLVIDGPRAGRHPILQLADALDELSLALRTLPHALAPGDLDPPDFDDDEARKLVARAFPQLGYYNVPLHVDERLAETSLAVGDAVDDLADLYRALRSFLWCLEAGGRQEAEATLDFDVRTHVGEHLVDLRWYVGRLAAADVTAS